MTRVSYNGDGDILDWDLRQDNSKAVDLGGTVKLKRHLEFARTPDRLFLALPFRGADSAMQCQDETGTSCPNKKPMIYRVRLYSRQGQPGLAVALKNNYTIYFVTVQSPSGFEFDNVEYNVGSSTVSGEMKNFEASLLNGKISSGNLNLRLELGTKLRMANVRFSRAEDRTGTVSANGSIEGGVGTGSEIAITDTGDNFTKLSLQSGRVSLIWLQLDVGGDRGTVLAVENGSTLNATILGSRLGFGAHGVLMLSQGSVTLEIDHGVWKSGEHPDVSGLLSLKTITISSGQVKLNPVTTIKVTGGRVDATELKFNSLQVPVVVGRFNDVQFDVERKSTIGVPQGVVVVTAAGGTLRSADITHPFEFVRGSEMPIGQVDFTLPFETLANAQYGKFGMVNGTLAMTLLRNVDGVITGKNISASGTVRFDISGNAYELPLQVANGTLTAEPGKDAKLDAFWTATFPGNVLFEMTTPFEKVPDKDERHFPVSLRIGLASDLKLENVPIKFVGRRYETSFTHALQVRVQVPAGCGEHLNPDDPFQGCKKDEDQDDQAKGNQEAFTDTFLPPANCRFHLYLKAATYDIPATAVVATAPDGAGGFTIEFPSFQVPVVQWTTDGCSGVMAVIDAFCGAAKGICGDCICGSLQDGTAAFIRGKVRDILKHQAERSWRIKL